MISQELWPALNALINTFCMLLLLSGWMAIKRGEVLMHKILMISAFASSVIFLISYLLYHAEYGSKGFEGSGYIRYVYFFILITHSILAAFVPFLAVAAIRYGFKDQKTKHRRIVRFLFPMWVYVSFTGVLVYIFLYNPLGIL